MIVIIFIYIHLKEGGGHKWINNKALQSVKTRGIYIHGGTTEKEIEKISTENEKLILKTAETSKLFWKARKPPKDNEKLRKLESYGGLEKPQLFCGKLETDPYNPPCPSKKYAHTYTIYLVPVFHVALQCEGRLYSFLPGEVYSLCGFEKHESPARQTHAILL